MTIEEIAAQDGVTDAAVNQSVRSYSERVGLPPPSPEVLDSTVSIAGLGEALGISVDAASRLIKKGVVSGVRYGRRTRFSVDEVRAALQEIGWSPGKFIFDPKGKRGLAVAARQEQRAAGSFLCSRCGAVIEHLPPSWLKRSAFWCSDCRAPSKRACDIKRRRMKEDTQVEPIDIRIVAERDGWRCAICRGRVTRKNWSLDHITPLSKGGPHTYENVVLAHRECNSKRGAGRFAVQVPLFARPPAI